ncbi:alpha/beta fold hydrolase [Paenibacillus sp. SC116]|uniref:alpha/beta fold hydrolase n=1 Tax=Paenibacillus sp. SC116 TaxID=2968986 RepID=UPI00215A4E74|nr:alpha/beta hydrolase [Paenibacillus sp. SC116]MCR8844493.1 alpha/beta fold hydrolase [Paenibacillus sp. SC116]
MSEQLQQVNGITICTEGFGDPTNPAVLLIMGSMCSMVYWDEQFCQGLADSGRFVIRYDNRDVGRSTTYEPGTSNYSLTDLADDAIGVLDAYGIKQSHIVGLSMGGLIAQIIAVRHPQRALTITPIASCTIFESNDTSKEYPPIDENIIAYHANSATLDWSDEQAVADYLVGGSALLCGSKHVFEKERAYKQVTQEIKRANHLLSMFNHALLASNSYEGSLSDIHIPTLVIHGDEDQVNHYDYALMLVNEIPNAALLTLKGTGHELHAGDWEEVIHAIVEHTSTIEA